MTIRFLPTLLLSTAALLGACTGPSPLANCEVSRFPDGYEEPDQVETYDANGFRDSVFRPWPGTRTTWINDDAGNPLVETVDLEDDGIADFRSVWFYEGSRLERLEHDFDMDGFRDEYSVYAYAGTHMSEESIWEQAGDRLVERKTYTWQGDNLVGSEEDGNGDGEPEVRWSWDYDDDRMVHSERLRINSETSDVVDQTWNDFDDHWQVEVLDNRWNDEWIDSNTLQGIDKKDGKTLWIRYQDYEGRPYSKERWVHDDDDRLIRQETDWDLDGLFDYGTDYVYACGGAE